MKKRYYIILVALLSVILFFQLNRTFIYRPANLVPKEEPNLRLETKDSKHDGKLDNWLYRDKNGVPVKWIRDSNHAGRPDKWSFFKDGRGFLDEEDTDHDGKVDQIQLSLVDAQGNKQRYISLKLKDTQTNTFDLQFDSGWLTEKDIEKQN